MMRGSILAALASVAVLAGCSSGGGDNVNVGKAVFSMAREVVRGGGSQADPRSGLTRAKIDAAKGSMMLVNVPSLGGTAVVTPVAANGSKITWVSADGKSLTTQGGYVIATRALPENLQALEVEGYGAALQSGGSYRRQMEFRNGRNEIIRETFTCTVTRKGGESLPIFGRSYAVTRYDDLCRGDSLTFENRYWIEAGGVLRQSRQWISKTVGYVTLQRLK